MINTRVADRESREMAPVFQVIRDAVAANSPLEDPDTGIVLQIDGIEDKTQLMTSTILDSGAFGELSFGEQLRFGVMGGVLGSPEEGYRSLDFIEERSRDGRFLLLRIGANGSVKATDF